MIVNKRHSGLIKEIIKRPAVSSVAQLALLSSTVCVHKGDQSPWLVSEALGVILGTISPVVCVNVSPLTSMTFGDGMSTRPPTLY